MKERQAQSRLDRRGAEVLLDARHDALDGGQRARRAEVEELVGQAGVRRQDREALCQRSAGGTVRR